MQKHLHFDFLPLTEPSRLRIAFVAGTLGQGGAEKQLVYMANALHQAGAQLEIYSLTQNEYYQSVLGEKGIKVTWVGQNSSPIFRLHRIYQSIRQFQPHILQSAHFFTNLYSSLVAKAAGCLDIGALRSDVRYEMDANGVWRKPLLHFPSFILTNTLTAKKNAGIFGVAENTIYMIDNVIDLSNFDRQAEETTIISFPQKRDKIRIALVAGLQSVKRIDRFLSALSLARRQDERIQGWIIGEGSEKDKLIQIADRLGLTNENGVEFLGKQSNIPALLKICDLLILTSDHEGFPNALIEGMAASLPVISTPAGDASRIVEDGVSGYIVPFEDIHQMARKIVLLAASTSLRNQMGVAGRRKVEKNYQVEGLADRLLSVYEQIFQASK